MNAGVYLDFTPDDRLCVVRYDPGAVLHLQRLGARRQPACSPGSWSFSAWWPTALRVFAHRCEASTEAVGSRSEERRVGKECRSRWSPHQLKIQVLSCVGIALLERWGAVWYLNNKLHVL